MAKDRDRLAEQLALAGAGDHRELATLATELGSVQSKLDEAEEQWLELAEAAEESG